MYSSVELARLVETEIKHCLEQDSKKHNGVRAVPYLKLYQHICRQAYGAQVTSGFFNRIVKNMKSCGVLGPIKPSMTVFLSQEAWEESKTKSFLNVYLAGRIKKNDWRDAIVQQHTAEDWRKTQSVEMSDGILCTGPFYIRCDHGCGHGDNQHGAGANGTYDCVDFVSQEEVFQKALAGIQACDLFYVWVGLDFAEAFGTLFEIGFARALGKRIVVAKHPDACVNDQWFALSSAETTVVAEDPIEGYKLAVGVSREQ